MQLVWPQNNIKATSYVRVRNFSFVDAIAFDLNNSILFLSVLVNLNVFTI